MKIQVLLFYRMCTVVCVIICQTPIVSFGSKGCLWDTAVILEPRRACGTLVHNRLVVRVIEQTL